MTEKTSWLKKIGHIIGALFILLGFLILSQVPNIASGLFQPIFNKENVVSSSLLLILWLIIFIGVIYITWGYYKKKSADTDMKITLKDIGRAFLFFLAGRVVVVFGSYLMTFIYKETETANDQAIFAMFGQDQSLVSVILLTITIAIGAPILEELVFRGLPTALLFKNTPVWIPLIVTSLAFSSMHLSTNLLSFLMYATLGGIMYWAYCSRGRIVDSMLVHFFNNFFSAMLLFYSYLFDVPFF